MKTKNKTEKIKNENKTKDVASMVVRVKVLTQVSVWARINPYVGLGYDKGYLLRARGGGGRVNRTRLLRFRGYFRRVKQQSEV